MNIYDFEYPIGITLHIQHIEILSILKSKDFTELELIIKSVRNILPHRYIELKKKYTNLLQLKEALVVAYKNSLLSRKDVKNIDLIREHTMTHIIEYLQINDKKDILVKAFNLEKENAYRYIVEHLPEHAECIIDVYSNFMSVEEPGIKETSTEAFFKLLRHIDKYDIIKIDGVSKYPCYVQINGRYNKDRLLFAFDFVRSLNKQAAINALVFYDDIPEELLRLKPTSKNKKLVKNKLEEYIDSLTKCIQTYRVRYAYNIVEDIELINEPFIRQSIKKYSLREKYKKDKHLKDDNVNPGWFKFITLKEALLFAKIVRKNLPKTQIKINECFLEQEEKTNAMLKLIKQSKRLERKTNISIIDCIGTQCHIDTSVCISSIIDSIKKFFNAGLFVEITELDVYVPPYYQTFLTPEMLNDVKLNYVNELISTLNQEQKCYTLTIWSISDKMNFMLEHIPHIIKTYKCDMSSIQPSVSNVFGGYYDENMNERESMMQDEI